MIRLWRPSPRGNNSRRDWNSAIRRPLGHRPSPRRPSGRSAPPTPPGSLAGHSGPGSSVWPPPDHLRGGSCGRCRAGSIPRALIGQLRGRHIEKHERIDRAALSAIDRSNHSELTPLTLAWGRSLDRFADGCRPIRCGTMKSGGFLRTPLVPRPVVGASILILTGDN